MEAHESASPGHERFRAPDYSLTLYRVRLESQRTSCLASVDALLLHANGAAAVPLRAHPGTLGDSIGCVTVEALKRCIAQIGDVWWFISRKRGIRAGQPVQRAGQLAQSLHRGPSVRARGANVQV
jgi:hypothetical protein